ncbi:16S rRNA (uracil(1498)-N(3))-methyltransferase [Phormidium sp. LEGE 05292]|uniref:16S rRNA (uracil(1498)-N(3))-methyltransferase n=1 Tax=[Phormidium] sp. LEGE 05292 TaxID=767427 RepID=UPI00187FCB53|nr:16S rRNA (uracil(1498)-N(3))-methyltransferase [Phormidium sp. LEGE 05292]MBE9226434.1 16S rRNA (uracil(1498)-N(3))-methyltransferase [Phormidium sp. LEGE 05292]
MTQLQRLTISSTQIQNQLITLTSEQYHYLSRVLRLQKDDRFIAMNGQGEWWLAKLLGQQAEIIEQIPIKTELPIAITLIIALPKNGFDEVVKQTTEIGVTKIIPVISDRTLLKPSPQKIDRWRRIANEAAEQSERQIIPEILEPIPFKNSFSLVNGSKYICYARGNSPHLLNYLIPSSNTAITIATGPEGGWTEREIEEAQAAEFQTVSLGKRILTAVLAPIVALSLVAAVAEMGSIKTERL